MTGMTKDWELAQAATLLSGADMESTKAVPERGIPPFVMTDGSNGLARNLPNFAGKVVATCYPTVSAMASTWDADLVRRVARAIASDARAAGAHVLLSPGMNLKRSPLGGRNFEYFSEDPQLTGVLAAAFVDGVQSAGIAACAKHFAVNNQESDRMRVSADVDERTLREVYLRGFERVVREAKPAMVMAAYNRINGVHSTQNRWLLTDVLRDEWGFDGVVVSDWGAVDDRAAALAAGLDLEMPGSGGASDRLVLDAVTAGEIAEATVRRSADRVAALARRGGGEAEAAPLDDVDANDLARRAAEAAAVLVKNDRAALPLDPGASVAVIGAFAMSPRFQGAGSAGVNAARTPTPIPDALRALHPGMVEYAAGYDPSGTTTTPAMLAEAAAVAQTADVAIVVAGLPEQSESEGFDRTHLGLPDAQELLIDAVAGSARATIVVLVAGGVVTIEGWRDRADAILLTGLAGQAVSDATARILTGAVSPSGRLTETVPLAVEHAPSHTTFPGEGGHSVYGEGIFVGYRGYDEQQRAIAYPFGHGLTYTTFEYGDPRVTRDGEEWVCEVEIRNVGRVAARDVVQLYASAPSLHARRARAELVAFDSVELAPGAAAVAHLRFREADLRRWQIGVGWVLDPGEYVFRLARSARDEITTVAVTIDVAITVPAVGPESTLAEWMSHEQAGPALLARVAELDTVGNTMGLLSDPVARLMIGGIPMKRLTVDAGNVLSLELLADVAASVA